METVFQNIHDINQYNESSYFNDMNGDVENCNVSGGYSYENPYTLET